MTKKGGGLWRNLGDGGGVWSGAPEEGLSATSAAPQRVGALEGGGWGPRCPARGSAGRGEGLPGLHLRSGARERAGPGGRQPAGAGRAVGVPRPPAPRGGSRRGRGAAGVRSAPRGERAAPPPAACARCCVPGPAPPPPLPSPPPLPQRPRVSASATQPRAAAVKRAETPNRWPEAAGAAAGERRGELRARRGRPGRAGPGMLAERPPGAAACPRP